MATQYIATAPGYYSGEKIEVDQVFEGPSGLTADWFEEAGENLIYVPVTPISDEDLTVNQRGLIKGSRAGAVQTIAIIGDSFTKYNDDNESVMQQSAWAWCLAELGDRVDVTVQAGVNGNNSAQMLARFNEEILDYNTDQVWGQTGANDFFGYDFTAETVFSNVSSMIELAISNGSKVVWGTAPPQGSGRSNFSTARSLEAARYNAMLLSLGDETEGLIVVDTYGSMVDWSSADASTSTGVANDEIHYSLEGSLLHGQKWVDAIEPFLPISANRSKRSPVVAGYIMPAEWANFVGSGGSFSTPATATGVVPASWALLVDTGGEGTMVGSHDQDGYRLDINKTTSVSTYFDIHSFPIHTETLGTETLTLDFIGSLEMSGGLEFEELSVVFRTKNASETVEHNWGQATSGFHPTTILPRGDFSIRTRPMPLLANHTDLRVYIQVRFSGVGDAVFRPKSCIISDVS